MPHLTSGAYLLGAIYGVVSVVCLLQLMRVHYVAKPFTTQKALHVAMALTAIGALPASARQRRRLRACPSAPHGPHPQRDMPAPAAHAVRTSYFFDAAKWRGLYAFILMSPKESRIAPYILNELPGLFFFTMLSILAGLW